MLQRGSNQARSDNHAITPKVFKQAALQRACRRLRGSGIVLSLFSRTSTQPEIGVATGLILDCNTTTATTFGYEKSQLIGRHLDQLQATESSSVAAELLNGLGEGGTVHFPHLAVRRVRQPC